LVQMHITRNRSVWLDRHALDGMNAERPKVAVAEAEETLEAPDRLTTEHDGRLKAWKRIGKRTIIVYYDEDEEGIYVRSVSATRSEIH
jgi:hypothetical protein